MQHDGIRIVMEAHDIREALERLAKEIIEQPVDPDKLALVGIHTGGVFLARRLEALISRQIKHSVPVGSLDINLYRDDWTRLHTQPVVRASHLPFPMDDRDIVLVDDVLYTGRTVRAALEAMIDYGRPRRVQVAVLVDRGHRELPICAQFVGLPLQTLADDQVDVLLVEKDGVDRVVIERTAAAATA